MFARRFYPGRFFAPRYWPAPGQSTSALPAVVLDLSLSHQPQETIAMNCATRNELRLQRHDQAELPLGADSAVPISLEPDGSLAIDLEYQPTIDLTLETGHAV